MNSTITANMNFTKTSPKFGQWSDHRANTVYGLGFTSEKDLVLVSECFLRGLNKHKYDTRAYIASVASIV